MDVVFLAYPRCWVVQGAQKKRPNNFLMAIGLRPVRTSRAEVFRDVEDKATQEMEANQFFF